MAVLGVVSEYNPFHNGHKYLFDMACQAEKFDAVVCVMSGNFTQRGEAALFNKWARAEMALASGADLVIELPFCFAVRSAYYFARGAMQLLQRTGVVTHLAFGCENNHLPTLQGIAEILSHEPDEFKTSLKRNLSNGLSFPLARSRALQDMQSPSNHDLHGALLGPNNILAIEYLRVMQEENIPFHPIAIKRQGSPYHDTEVSCLPSATAIRQALIHNADLDSLRSSLPPGSIDIIDRELANGRKSSGLESLERSIIMMIRSMSTDQLRSIYEVNDGLEYRIKEAANHSGTLYQLLTQIKSKRYNMTRISRSMLYILFSLTKDQMQLFDRSGPQYLHLLGFSAKGQKILQVMKINSRLTIVNRASDMKKLCEESPDPVLSQMANLDRLATDMYSLLYSNPDMRKGSLDYTMSPIRTVTSDI
ncbi:MAG: nucleotidyltransferase [Syntrophomonadaceae bacterium]|nr:nucleotidyltransferase [Syntrophomonadaceae bacterium]